MTQGGFAEEILGMPESSFSRLMSGGRPSYETLVLISDALGLELLSEPTETDKREKKTCTQAELRDCLERMRDLDTTDIGYIMRMVRSILEEKPKKGKAKRRAV